MPGKRTLARKFLEELGYIDEGFKLKLRAADVRKFLTQQQAGLTFQAFNKMMHCEGRTTKNKYVYDLIGISNAIKGRENQNREKEFTEESVKVLSYYGSKRSWRKEFELIYKYAAQSLECTTMIDGFAGSGFLALLAAKTGVFDRVILNELSTTVFNYHLAQQDTRVFEEFTHYLFRFGHVEEPIYQVMKKHLNLGRREKRVHVAKASATKAAALFIVKNYAHSGQGGYIEARMDPREHIEALERTQKLYDSIELSHYHYKKVLEKYMNDDSCLILLDPPYMQEARGQKKSYNLEFEERQHRTLLQLLTKQEIKAKIVLCGYHSQMYENYFIRYNQKQGVQPWHEIKLLRAGSKQVGAVAKEHIWVNFDMSSLVSNHQGLFQTIW